LVVPLDVVWRRSDGVRVRESAHTEVVSAHGALLRINLHLPRGTEVELIHHKTRQSARAHVVATYPNQPDGVPRIAVELSVPSSTFWGLTFSVSSPTGEKP
jgi:hypothetical protein